MLTVRKEIFLSTFAVAWSHDDEDSPLESGALVRSAIEAFPWNLLLT